MSRSRTAEQGANRYLPMPFNLGCGADVRDGWLNVDIDPVRDDVVQYDLEKTPWPWGDESAPYVLLDNVLEHLDPRTRSAVLEECHRVLEPDGTLEVVLPQPAIGGGWDVSHYSVPSWEFYRHPRHRHRWELIEREPMQRIGVGRLMPEELALLATRHGWARCVNGVRIRLSKSDGRDGGGDGVR